MHFDIEAARSSVESLERPAPAALRRDIEALARPRLAGSEGGRETEAALRHAFDQIGFEARALPFTFSTWPGRFGLSLAGACLMLAGGFGAWLIVGGAPLVALVVLAVGLALALAPLYYLEPALRRLPWGRIESANLLFTRPGKRPSWIVMAHRDTKSQRVPTLVRTGALLVGAAGWTTLFVLAGLWLAHDLFRFPMAAWIAGGCTVLAGVVLALSWAGNESPGALDNATGLAALLAVARSQGDGDVGFLVTDGEELGLAGARAVVGETPAVQGVINLDGLDDCGEMIVAEGHGLRRKGSAPQLVAALLTAGRALDLEIRRRRLPRTVPVDHIPLAAAGIPAVTLLRGEWRSLARVHLPGDRADRLTGDGAAESATTVAAALHLLRETRTSHLAGGGAVAS